jgi:conflict system pore-forming effector with SLATT domain
MFGTQPHTPDPFTPPDWSGDATTHLESLRVYAERKIDGDLSWYYRRKSGRAFTSQALRFFAVALTVLGGLVPVVISLFGSRPPWGWLAPFASIRIGQLGYLFLALAGGLFLLDKYFGYSSGWMRYVLAMQAIEKAREGFRLDWTGLCRTLSTAQTGTQEYSEVVERMIQRVRSAIVEVKEQSEKETQAWILEFQTNLAQLEKDLKSQMEAGRPGGVDVEVTDGRKADTPVELSLDGMIADRFSGTAGSIGYVAPGLHRVTAKAQKTNRDYAASALVNVGGGQICQVKLTLGIP